ncbi:hypothetical protein GOHSU_10_00020 [Gordonia hirsuta DSM 44140 = NBRC 16056]|uniref:Uncharacterized protein n=1 Tax=Gordonia hirsuta DSM 44140 = NBRC 16056 TaxID=1121927 RepID=L7L786_9ACTN|nr:hypothetical protein [Gordonia hirsuta]GAC56606.1 hypothetical protein GOHSU_10_00020 [Gordonia hirsuta DSM 44140 = NBRC 16056]
MNIAAALEAVGAQARADFAAAHGVYRRTAPGVEPMDDADSLPRLMVPVRLDRVEPCSGRRRS